MDYSLRAIDSLRFGVDYYPEHWPKKRWETDAQLMKEMGIQVVRMAEFAWHKMEPKKGCFCFEWLDEAIDLLGKYGIYTILGTPTAAPPAWIIEEEPDILPVNSKGERMGFGGRHHDCQSNSHYREHIRRLVTAMALHYRDNPLVLGWQIDNELGNSHWDLCMCESCRQAFQQWLERKYKNIERLNQEWGTVFWSQTYDCFSQIPAPKTVPTVHNPSLLLDWKRFCSDLVIDFQKMQIDIIRSIAPHQKITHNLMGFYDKTDYFKMAEDLDFASNDQYPTGYYFEGEGQPPYEVAACMDFIRCVKKKNFWMMEMQSGPTGGSVIGAQPRPGQNRLWTVQSVAHGADTIVYFRWRTCLFGTEQFWHGILPHSGSPGRRYKEIQDTIQMLAPVMEDVRGIVTKSPAGILFSYDQDWALRLQPQHPKLEYTGTIQNYYRAFYEQHIPVDFLSEEDDFEEYRVLIAPLLYLMTPALADKLERFVQKGGRLLLTMRTGVMNENNVCMDSSPLPGRLLKLAGTEVEEYDCLREKEVTLKYSGCRGKCSKWCDILQPHTAEPLAFYGSEFYTGRAAITVNFYGKGQVYYVGTQPDLTVTKWLILRIMQDIPGILSYSQNPVVEFAVRSGRKKDYLFVLNHSEEKQTVALPDAYDKAFQGEYTLSPYETLILEKEH